jgi:hypothetical protein
MWGLNLCFLILITIFTHVDFLVNFIFKFKLYSGILTFRIG